VKGDMARSILYMLDCYGLPLPNNMQPICSCDGTSRIRPTTWNAGAIL